MRKIVCAVICIAMAFTCLNIGTIAESDLQDEIISCKEYFCPFCLAEPLTIHKSVANNNSFSCCSCGKDLKGFNPLESFEGAKYPGEYWYCDRCSAFLNSQEGFDDHVGTWVCTECGYENSISYDMEAYTWTVLIDKTIGKGNTEFREGNYEIALSNFTQARDWTIGLTKEEKTNLQQIIALDLRIEDCKRELYLLAKQWKTEEQYTEAIEAFEYLDTYEDSASLAIECRFLHAIKLGNCGDYDSAIAEIESLGDKLQYGEDKIDDAVDLIELWYQYAIILIRKGDLDKAIEILTRIGHYKDSMDLLRKCCDNMHIQWCFVTNRTDAINAGKDTGYSKKERIDDKDPHFGWCLGRFWVSGYTEMQKENGVPVFLKTPGDNMILWFNLEQDIDALNGDKNLSIARDKNGIDLEFQIPKSDFGRGALFIKHIDSKNADSDPQQYRDYLAAHDDTGANTRVEIKEEGTYQVALDYEIARNSKIAVIPTTDYYDYRISFTFEVRNGSGMFYLFDLSTGSELQDYSVANNGFRIDLANSHTLSIHYTREVLNQSGTGLDVRKAENASDGDTFNKTGYYEIEVTNTETNEKLTKHVFVGSDGDLEEYKEADPTKMSNF